MKNILFIVGSLREGSFNHQMAKQAESILSGQATVTYLDYKDIPLMNQDFETPVLPAVQAARDAIMAADAIWIFSPVYNFAIPETNCQGLFNQVYKEVTFCGLLHGADA